VEVVSFFQNFLSHVYTKNEFDFSYAVIFLIEHVRITCIYIYFLKKKYI
jgi:hypothetical protein